MIHYESSKLNVAQLLPLMCVLVSVVQCVEPLATCVTCVCVCPVVRCVLSQSNELPVGCGAP